MFQNMSQNNQPNTHLDMSRCNCLDTSDHKFDNIRTCRMLYNFHCNLKHRFQNKLHSNFHRMLPYN